MNKFKIFSRLLLASMVMFFVSCSKDNNLENGNKNVGPVEFTVTTSIPQTIQTYASENGGATNVDPNAYVLRYIMEAWTKEATPRLAYRDYKIVENNFKTEKVTFSAQLLAMEYNFVFWADFIENTVAAKADPHGADLFYTTNNGVSNEDIAANPSTADPGLTKVKINPDVAYKLSNDARDAFYASVSVDLSTQNVIDKVSLIRPFGKYRLISFGIDGFLETAPITSKIEYKAAAGSASGTITLPAGFDALNKSVSTERIDVAASVFSTLVAKETSVTVGGKTYNNVYILGFDYIFADNAQTVAMDVETFDASDNLLGSKRSLSNIPVHENKLTTIIGNFFTSSFEYTVCVDDDILGNIDLDGVGNVKTVYLDPAQTSYTIPTAWNVYPSVLFILPENHTVALTIEDETTATPYVGHVFFGNPKAKKKYSDLTIVLPEATVSVYDDVDNLTATTKSNTLIIEKGSIVGHLNAIKGNVDIYGKLTTLETGNDNDVPTVTANIESIATDKITKNGNTKFYWRAATADQLTTALAYPATLNHGVILAADIKDAQTKSAIWAFAIGGYSNYADYDGYVFDGKGHTLSGYQTEGTNSGNVLASYSNNVTIKNLTIEKPSNLPTATKLSGITILSSTDVILENVTVKDLKQAGVIVNSSKVTAKGLHTSGNGWGGVNVDGAGSEFDFSDAANTFDEATKVWAEYVASPCPYTITPIQGWTSVEVPNGSKYATIYYPYSAISPAASLADVIANAASGSTLGLVAGATYNIGTGLTFDKAITIDGNGAIISSASPADQTALLGGSTIGNNPAILINTTGSVTLKNLLVTTEQTPVGKLIDGITVINGDLIVENVTFDGIVNAGGQNGGQNGRCITVLSDNKLTATGCTFKRYNKNGIHMTKNSEATIDKCTFIGVSPVNDGMAQNGIVFVNTSRGSVYNCSFKDFEFGYGVLAMSTGSVIDGGGNTYNNCDGTWYY